MDEWCTREKVSAGETKSQLSEESQGPARWDDDSCTLASIITKISKNKPVGNEFKWLLIESSECIYDIFSHAITLAL